MHLHKKSHLVESDALPLTFGSEGLEAATHDNPFTILCGQEEGESGERLEVASAGYAANRRFIYYLLDGGKKHPVDALADLYLTAFMIDERLVGDWKLKEIAATFDMTKQAFSKRQLQKNKELNIRNRNQKSDTARQTYSELATEWHKHRAPERKLALQQKAQTKAEREAEARRKELAEDYRAAIAEYNERNPQAKITAEPLLLTNDMTDDNTADATPAAKPKQEISEETRAKLREAAKKRHAKDGGFKKAPKSPVEQPSPMAKATEAQTQPKAVEQAPKAKKANLPAPFHLPLGSTTPNPSVDAPKASGKRHTMITAMDELQETLGFWNIEKLLAANHRISISNLDGQASITIDKE